MLWVPRGFSWPESVFGRQQRALGAGIRAQYPQLQ